MKASDIYPPAPDEIKAYFRAANPPEMIMRCLRENLRMVKASATIEINGEQKRISDPNPIYLRNLAANYPELVSACGEPLRKVYEYYGMLDYWNFAEGAQ